MGPRRLIIGGDVNAKSIWWGGVRTDERGEDLLAVLDELGLQILNRGETPTFDTIRGNYHLTSYVDITACTEDVLELVEDWKVLDNITGSDHNAIEMKVRLLKSTGHNINRTTRLYNTKKAKWAEFRAKLDQLMQEKNLTAERVERINSIEDLNKAIDMYTDAIKEACAQTIPKKAMKEKLTVPWWSDTLEKLKKEVVTRKRRIRCAASVRRAKVVEEYLKKKEEYEISVRKAQVESWKQFCGQQDTEGLWEGIYRVINRTTKRVQDVPIECSGVALDAEGSAKLLAETFYPTDNPDEDKREHKAIREQAKDLELSEGNGTQDPSFTLQEMKEAVMSFNPKKAPGPDGLTADICAQAVMKAPKLFLGLLNKCLELGCFPLAWKEAVVIVLRKPGKTNYTSPKSHRPVGLLAVLGKVYEKMVVARLKHHTLRNMSSCQYGFMPQKSTEDSLYTMMKRIKSKLDQKKLITLVSLDIEGAFDSAWWPMIKVRLAAEGCPGNLRRVMDDYLKDRIVAVRYMGSEHKHEAQKGCVQGSIGGPYLWNLLLDPLLKGLVARGDYVQAFADDVVLIFDGDTAQEVQQRANAALEYVQGWGVRNKMKFAPHKTCAMIITRKLKHDTPHLTMGGIDIGMSNEIKILGLTIDNKLTFNKHVANTCAKAIAIYKHLARSAKVTWGLHPEVIRRIYTAVVEPIVLYASSAWALAARKLGVQKRLNATQRGFAQKLCRAYRTTSLNAALVLAGLLPLDLRIGESAKLYEAKKGVPQPALGDREVERMASAMDGPHPAEHCDIELGSLVNEEQYTSCNIYAVRIFTDGSKIEGKVGAALSVWSGNEETKTLKLALAPYCTVYQAELLALCEAMREVLRRKEDAFAILSDSMAALQTVKNPAALHPLAVEIRDAIRGCKLQNKSVSLFWIKAHLGLEGNERADSLAKEAALRSKKKPNYDLCPVSYVKRRIRMESLEEWDRRYRAGETASITKIYFPSAIDAYGTVRKLTITSELTQALTGHGGFSEYLTRFKRKENPACICDPGENETIMHLLLKCPQFSRERFRLEIESQIKMKKENLSVMIKSKDIRDIFISYAVKIVKTVCKRNSD